jgi:hypothetical protein
MVEEIVPVLRVADADTAEPHGCEFELRDPDGNRLRTSTRDR